jgi:hypothetical protein
MANHLGAAPKTFSREEAEKMLPLIRSIVRDIVETRGAFQNRIKTYWQALELEQRGGSVPPDFNSQAAGQEIQSLRLALADSVEELKNLGVICRDPDAGIVEFPTRVGAGSDRLSWKLGDIRITVGNGPGTPLSEVRDIGGG